MKTPRRLLVISHGFPPYYGGAEHAAGCLARAAVKSGRWTVDVLTSDIGGRLPAREEWAGVSVIRVPARKREWKHHTVPELLSFMHSATRRLEIQRPDLILAHFTIPGGEVARIWARRFGVPYAVVMHGSDVPGGENARFRALYPIVKPWVRRVWRGAAAVLAVSESLRVLALRTWPGGHIDIVPNGVDVDLFHPATLPDRPEQNNIVIVTVARLVEIKGIHYLIDALALMPDNVRSRIRLRLFGTGSQEGRLRHQAQAAGVEAQVEFGGLAPYSQIPDILRSADVFALPSLQEGLPLSLLEAMATGLPVVTTPVGGIPDVIRDGVNGLMVPCRSAVALRDALVRLAGDPRLRAQLGEAAQRDAPSWSWTAAWERYEDAMRETSPSKGSP